LGKFDCTNNQASFLPPPMVPICQKKNQCKLLLTLLVPSSLPPFQSRSIRSKLLSTVSVSDRFNKWVWWFVDTRTSIRTNRYVLTSYDLIRIYFLFPYTCLSNVSRWSNYHRFFKAWTMVVSPTPKHPMSPCCVRISTVNNLDNWRRMLVFIKNTRGRRGSRKAIFIFESREKWISVRDTCRIVNMSPIRS